MIQTSQELKQLPRTFEEFLVWEPNDGFNGVARAVRMEPRRAYQIYRNEKRTALHLRPTFQLVY